MQVSHDEETDGAFYDDDGDYDGMKRKGKLRNGIYGFGNSDGEDDDDGDVDEEEEEEEEGEEETNAPRNPFFNNMRRNSNVKQKKVAQAQLGIGVSIGGGGGGGDFVAASKVPLPPQPKIDYDSEINTLEAELKAHQAKMAGENCL